MFLRLRQNISIVCVFVQMRINGRLLINEISFFLNRRSWRTYLIVLLAKIWINLFRVNIMTYFIGALTFDFVLLCGKIVRLLQKHLRLSFEVTLGVQNEISIRSTRLTLTGLFWVTQISLDASLRSLSGMLLYRWQRLHKRVPSDIGRNRVLNRLALNRRGLNFANLLYLRKVFCLMNYFGLLSIVFYIFILFNVKMDLLVVVLAVTLAAKRM